MKLLAAVFLFVLVALPAWADDFGAGLIVGYDVLTGDSGRVSDDGVCFGAYADYFMDPDLAIEGTVTYSSHDDVVDDEGSHTVDVLSITIGPRFLFPRPKMVPFISFGPSLYMVDYKFDPENGPGTYRKDDDTEAGLFASAGLRFPITKRLVLGFSLSYHYVFNTDVLDGDIMTTSISVGF